MVVVRRDVGMGSLEMAAFGFSGPGTEALGEKLLWQPDDFWSPSLEVNGKEIGVYICGCSLTRDETSGRAGVYATDVKIIAIEDEILKAHIK